MEKTAQIPCDADASTVKKHLLELTSIGEIEVTRSMRSPVGGYTWTISFLEDFKGTNRGDVPDLKVISNLHGGIGVTPVITVREVRKGTWKEVQKISVTAGGATVNPLTLFQLEFEGQITGDIQAMPLDGTACIGSAFAKQLISTSTMDTSNRGGDKTVSPRTTFTIFYKGFETGPIHANIGDCNKTATIIREELTRSPHLHKIQVSGSSTSKQDEGCEWEVLILGVTGSPESLQGMICSNAISNLFNVC
jgi:hypothetical protein